MGAAVVLVLFPLLSRGGVTPGDAHLVDLGLRYCGIWPGSPMLAEVCPGFSDDDAVREINRSLNALFTGQIENAVPRVGVVKREVFHFHHHLRAKFREELNDWVGALEADWRGNLEGGVARLRSRSVPKPSSERVQGDAYSSLMRVFEERSKSQSLPLSNFGRVAPVLPDPRLGPWIETMSLGPGSSATPSAKREAAPDVANGLAITMATKAPLRLPAPLVFLPDPIEEDLSQPSAAAWQVASMSDPVVPDEDLRRIEDAIASRSSSTQEVCKHESFVKRPWNGPKVCELAEGVDKVWFIGDLHGDRRALEAALLTIDRHTGLKSSTIVFLGDLVDDGGDSHGVVSRVLGLWLERPDHTILIAGNHDVALKERPDQAGFWSEVQPADYSEWLNDAASDHQKAEARTFIRLVGIAPRAVRLPDGLLAVHGGVPHVDLHAGVNAPSSLEAPECLQDFTWLRVAPRAKRRIPNRTNRSCELGADDIVQFRNVVRERLDRDISRIIRGHDHLDVRFEFHPAHREVPVLTINTLSRRLPREITGPDERMPCIARWTPGAMPTVYRLKLVRDAEGVASPEVSRG